MLFVLFHDYIGSTIRAQAADAAREARARTTIGAQVMISIVITYVVVASRLKLWSFLAGLVVAIKLVTMMMLRL